MRRTSALVMLAALGLLSAGTLTDPAPASETHSEGAALELAAPRAPSEPPVTTAPADTAPARGEPTPPGSGTDVTVAGRERAEAAPDAAPDAEGTVAGAEPSEARQEPVARDQAPIETTFLIAAAPTAGGVAGSGPRWRYTIEVAADLGIDVEEFATSVRAALTDERSWVRTRTLEQVDDPARARIRVVLASPDTVDELCGRVGLRTAGIYSCWNGRFAALNSWRWEVGADGFDDIATYRNYLVNHEFGHGLGYGHVGCPTAGAPAPVMMQQSKGVGDCIANGWPYP